MILLRCPLPLLLLLLRLLHLHWRASFMGVFRQHHSMHLVALAVGGLDHRDALLPHGLAVRHGGDGSHGALLFELLRLLVLLLLGRGWRCFNIWQFGAGLRGRRLCRRSRGERRRLWHRGCNWRRGHVGEVPSRALVRRWGVGGGGVQFSRSRCHRRSCPAPCECSRACGRRAPSQTAQQTSVPTKRGPLVTQIFQHADGEHQNGLDETRR